jgi:hypothetical protein
LDATSLTDKTTRQNLQLAYGWYFGNQ